MKKYLCYAGIDVSKSKLDVTFVRDALQKQSNHFIVTNNRSGIQQLLKRLGKQKNDLKDVLISFEDTGVYSLPLACYLSEKQLDYWMIPAIEIKRSKGISRGKTDKSDSKDIAFYSLTHLHKLKLSSIPEKEIMELKLLFTEREKVMKAILLLQSTQECVGYIPAAVMKSVIKINAAAIKQLQKALLKIETAMQQIIKANDYLQQQYNLINSIPGIGTHTATYLMIVTKGFQSFDNWRQLACYAGVAPFEYSSGSSIRGRTKVNHLADKKLKSLLNLCALNAKKHDHQLKEYYIKKVAEGKAKMLVLNNIRCKLLSRVFAVINRQTPYINTYKFAA